MRSDKYIKTSVRTDIKGLTFVDVIKKDTYELIASIPLNSDDELIVHNDYTVIGSQGDLNYNTESHKEQPYPVQRALKRIKEIDYITDVRIDEEFETTVDGFPENRLTITIDYLDVDFVAEMKKS
ncbi:hypothetical protein [Aerococcus urinaeequi]|uniref:hypothetical protein n=1 Tax=Aerococcus urinaeequi TaxID=51665 RepID=UPI0036713826